MTYVERVKAAKSPKEALYILAEGLDKLAAAGDEWDSWGQSDWPAPAAAAPELELGTGDTNDQDALARQYAKDPDSVCTWCHCFPIKLGDPCPRCGNRAARGPQPDPPMGDVEMIQGPDGVEFRFPEPSPEKAERRRQFERDQLGLGATLGPAAGDHDWNELYVKAGPFWVYQHNRDLVMSYPRDVRRAMVADVHEDSPKLAYEMSLDVNKEDAGEPDLETGAGALGVGVIDGKSLK